MNELENIQCENPKKEIGFFNHTIKRVEELFLKFNKKDIPKTPESNIKNTISNIKRLNLPSNIEFELLSKLYSDLENEELKFRNN
jgi:hypothetical protein